MTDEDRSDDAPTKLAAAYEEHAPRARRINEEWRAASSEATDDL